MQRSITIVGLILSCLPVQADSPKFEQVVTKVEARFDRAKAARGETVTWTLTMQIADGWHTYPSKQPIKEDTGLRNVFRFPSEEDIAFVGEIIEPSAKTGKLPEFDGKEMRYCEGKLIWKRPCVIRPDAAPGKKAVKARINVIVADDMRALIGRIEAEASIEVTDGPARQVEQKYRDQLPRVPATAPVPAAGNTDEMIGHRTAADYRASLEAIARRMHDEERLSWGANLEHALEQATRHGSLVFLTVRQATSTNAKLNDERAFKNPEVRRLLARCTLVELCTDEVPRRQYAPAVREALAKEPGRTTDDAQANAEFASRLLRSDATPQYALLQPLPSGGVRLLAIYRESLISDENAFAEFLRQHLAGETKSRARR